MPHPPHPEVLIVGAGAAGLTLAIDLARRNVPLRLIDKADAPFPGSRGKGLQPRSQEVFEDLGVLDRMAARGAPYPPARLYRAEGCVDQPLMESQPDTPAIPYGTPLMLPQNLTEAALRERLAEFGVQPEFGCMLTGFDQDGDSVAARLATQRGEETIRVRYLVGADGGGSSVRRALGVGFPGETAPGRGLVADVALEGLGRDAWHRWETASGRLMLCPLAGTDLFQLQTAIAPDGDPDLSDQAIVEMIHRAVGRSEVKVRAVHWRSAFGVNMRVADRYRVDRAFLAGDAAHVHPPTGGQGLNTSVQDAYGLGWRLGAALEGAPDSLLDTYETERRPIALQVLELSTSLLRAAQERGEMRRGRENHELDLGYFDSPLSLEVRPRRGSLPAGARAPDAPCMRAGGQPTRLFELFRGPHWTLLCCEPGPALQPRKDLSLHRIGPDGDIRDAGGHIAAAYDLAPGDRALVRPDGYIGAIMGPGEEAALGAYMRRVGLG